MSGPEETSSIAEPGNNAGSDLEANKVEDTSENTAIASIIQQSIRDAEESGLSNVGTELTELDSANHGPDTPATLDDADTSEAPIDDTVTEDEPIYRDPNSLDDAGMDVDSNNPSPREIDDNAEDDIDSTNPSPDTLDKANGDTANLDLVKTEPEDDPSNSETETFYNTGTEGDSTYPDPKTLYNTDTGSDSANPNPDSHNNVDTEADLFGLNPNQDNTKVVILMNKDSHFNVRYKPDTSNYKHKCPQCDEMFRWPHKLKQHVGIVHEGKYPFHCDICNKPFDRKSSLADHQMVHTDAKPYECVECDKSFKFKGNLRKHVRETHLNKDMQFECEHCHKVFSNKEKLQAHFVVHQEVKTFFCQVCGKGFLRKHNLREHEIIHKDEKNFECTECGMKFNRKYSLKIHARNHMAVKPYQCALCPSSFAQLHALKNHIRLHTGERPYECRFCSRSFAQMGTLQAHEKRHSGEKDFKCGECGVGFVLKRRLEEHMRVHTKEKPFECDLCPYRASTTSGLRYHKQNHLKRFEREAFGDVDGMERAQPVIDDGDLRRSRMRKVNATNNVEKKKRGRGRSKSEKSEMLEYYDIKPVGRKRKKDMLGDGDIQNGRGRGRGKKLKRNEGMLYQVGDVKPKMEAIANGGTEDGTSIHAMLVNALPSLDFNELKKIPVTGNYPFDSQLIQDSIDKVVGDLAKENGDASISRFSSLNKANPPMDVKLLQSDAAHSSLQNYKSSSEQNYKLSADTRRKLDEDSNSAGNDPDGTESGMEPDDAASDADEGFVVQINNDYDGETEDEAEEQEEALSSNGLENNAESNEGDNVLVQTNS